MSDVTPSEDSNQQHDADSLKFDRNQMFVDGYPYRFSMAYKKDDKLFYRCMECRNLKQKIKNCPQSYIIGSLIFNSKENILKGHIVTPGGFKHLCDDPTLCPLPTTIINDDFDLKLSSRIPVNSSLYSFKKLSLKLVRHTKLFKKIGCSEGMKCYVCSACVTCKDYKHDVDNLIIFEPQERTLYSNVGGLTNLNHVCSERFQEHFSFDDHNDGSDWQDQEIDQPDFNDNLSTLKNLNSTIHAELMKLVGSASDESVYDVILPFLTEYQKMNTSLIEIMNQRTAPTPTSELEIQTKIA